MRLTSEVSSVCSEFARTSFLLSLIAGTRELPKFRPGTTCRAASSFTTRARQPGFHAYCTRGFWHFGQKCEERCATSTLRMAVPQFTHGEPVRWYTRWLN